MKLVFYADLNNVSASGRQRLWALEQCGVEVFIFNQGTYPPKFGRWSGHISKLLKQPQLMRNAYQLERDLINLCEHVRPDLIWFEWPKELQPLLFHQLKQLRPRPLLISFQDDNPWGSRHNDEWMWKNYFKIIPEFDIHLVKRTEDIQNLKRLGAKHCYIWEHGIYSPLFYPPATYLEKKFPVSFIGTYMDQRIGLINYLLEQGIPIHIFGNRWNQRNDLIRKFPANFHPAVEGENYADVIRQSQICLGLVSHSNKDEWTMRTYEVPGCASLLLAERTSAHEKLFIENKDAAFFSTTEECLDKLLELLPNPNHCWRMGEAAHQKFIDKNWTLECRMQKFLTHLKTTQL